jgi:hypothetical protein
LIGRLGDFRCNIKSNIGRSPVRDIGCSLSTLQKNFSCHRVYSEKNQINSISNWSQLETSYSIQLFFKNQGIMNEKNEMMIPEEVIMSKIYFIRGQKVMFDKDLAELYEVETKALKQAVRRNIDIFPDHFMFELTEEEFSHLRSQIVTSSWGGL